MRITKLIMTKTGSYADMVSRPYETVLDAQSAAEFESVTQHGNNLTASNLAGIAGRIIKPSATHEGQVGIENGWETERLRFYMEVEHDERMGGQVTQILTGYTNYVGVSANGNIDPAMRLFFNSSTDVRHVIRPTPTGRVRTSNVADTNQIITGSFQPSSLWESNSNAHSMRPEDLFCQLQGQGVAHDGLLMDTRSTFAQGMKFSRRSNALAPSYVSNVMSAYKQATASDEYAGTAEDMYESARGNVRERDIHNNGFLFQLSQMSQLQENGSLTFGELSQLDNSLPERTVIAVPSRTQQTSVPQRGQFEHWNGTTMETVAATIISHAVPALMMELLMSQCWFMSTNDTYGGHFETRILGVKGFNENVDMSPYCQQFIRRLEVEIMRDLTRNNEMSVQIEVGADVIGDTRIKVSLNGQETIEYVTPSFCDALIAPVVTSSQDRLNMVSSDFDQLFNHSVADCLGERLGHSETVIDDSDSAIDSDDGGFGGPGGFGNLSI